jgi:hypothetical protein
VPLNPEGEAAPKAGRHEDRAEDSKSARRRVSEQKEMLRSKRQELRKIRQETFAAKDGVERAERVEKAKKTRLELLALKNELRGAREGNPEVRTVPPSEGEEAQTTEALPDFVIAGAQKGAPIVGAGRSGPNSSSMDIPRLIVRPQGGLANRMRVINSFQTLARRLGRVFELCWAPSDGWSEEDLNVLFENSFPRVPLDEFEMYSQNGLDLHEAVRIVGRGNERTWEWREGSGMHQVFDPEAFPVVTYSGQKRCENLVDPATRMRLFPHFESAYLASVKEWSPVPSIRAKVESLAATFGPHTVGVHIRRGDAWDQPDASLASKYRRSSDAAFFARMDAELVAEPRTNFFLATDSLETEERFRDHYWEAVMVNPDKRFVPSVHGRPKDNQRDAVIDMFALARTRKILGNNYSSFSRMAADIGGIGYERVREN